ncbi:MoaF protein precursor [Alloactinosynnema sp. L-07]|uniref:MoaF C-terminal domain-containing protein n=1 Tax=Alloactinosynnema sp. L-07 TaxID=1653480 RepID=UPI00065EF2B2|nr:MoaF C-terminal domain-containing protein [Alloactinosynnema sp. L-07]CRK57833.1 MoaF protein precursor [Alloactinosynnema sp. L-07]
MSEWKAVDDFAAGIDGNRLPSVSLDGTVWSVDGRVIEFGAATAAEDGVEDRYDAVEGAPGVYFVDRTFASTPHRAEVLVVDTTTGRTLTVVSTIADEDTPGTPRVAQTFQPGTLDGHEVIGAAPAPTRDLIGWRALYRYSPNHLYEHVYLSSQRYAWQCLVGEQRGHGDVDLATAYTLGGGLYVFTFREFRIPVATVWLYDLDAMRTTGVFFGLGADGTVRNAPGGANITALGRVAYPDTQPV